MRIDGTYRPQSPGATPLNDALDAAKTAPQAPAGQNDPGQTQAIGADSLASYTEKIRNIPEINVEAVAEAKRLMAAGELDTPEAVLRAAEAIIDNGI